MTQENQPGPDDNDGADPGREVEQAPDRGEADAPGGPATTEPAAPPAAVSAGFPWGLASFLVLSVLLVVFAVQNTQAVELRFLGWSGEFPLVIIIVVVAVVAVVLDEALGVVMRRRRLRRAREKEELRRLRAETKRQED